MKDLNTRIYFITDSTPYTEQEFLERVQSALKGGVSLIQLREKERTTREYIDFAQKVHALAKQFNVPLIIDDRIDVALAAHTEGVHLGQSDMPVKTAREILGDDIIIGATAKTVEQALEAFEQGADYLGVGAIYPTTTKVKTVLTSTQMLDKICRAVPIPVNAIGGLNKDNIDVLKGIGISGICAVSAIMKATDPENAVKELSAAVKEKLGYDIVVVNANAEYELEPGSGEVLGMEEAMAEVIDERKINDARHNLFDIRRRLEDIIYNTDLAVTPNTPPEKLARINNVILELEKSTVLLGSILTEGDVESENIELSDTDRANIAAAKAREEEKKNEQEKEQDDGGGRKKKKDRKKRR